MNFTDASHFAYRRSIIRFGAAAAMLAAIPELSRAGAASQPSNVAAAPTGRFIGEIKLRPVDGTNFELLEDYGYVDPAGARWQAKAGLKTDGASIPRVFWPIVGQPLGGLYLNAAIVHDYYCDHHYREWDRVHHVFHDAMLTNRVSRTKAALMFFAVWRFGPRWKVKDILACTPGPNEYCADSLPARYEVTTQSVIPNSYSDSEEAKKLQTIKAQLESVAISVRDIPDLEASQPPLRRDDNKVSIDASTPEGWFYSHPYQIPIGPPPKPA